MHKLKKSKSEVRAALKTAGLAARTSARARALSPACRLPLACSLLQRRQPPAFLQPFSDF